MEYEIGRRRPRHRKEDTPLPEVEESAAQAAYRVRHLAQTALNNVELGRRHAEQRPTFDRISANAIALSEAARHLLEDNQQAFDDAENELRQSF